MTLPILSGNSYNPCSLLKNLSQAAQRLTIDASSTGRCFRAVDAMLDESPKLIAIDEQPNHQVVHMLCLRKTDRPTDQPLDPRAQVDVLALDLLRVGLAHRVLLGLHMSLIGTPAVDKRARDAEGLQ